MNLTRKILIGLAASLALCIIAVYAYGCLFYSGHYLPGTMVNGINVGNLAPGDVAGNWDLSGWVLTFRDIDGKDVDVAPESIGLKTVGDTVESVLDRQSAALWPARFIGDTSVDEYSISISYDRDMLVSAIKSLDMVNVDKRVSPEDARIEYDASSKSYSITEETQGNLVDENRLIDAAVSQLDKAGFEPVTVEVSESMLVQPAVRKDDAKLVDAVDKANTALGAEISYSIDGRENALHIGRDEISQWVSISDGDEMLVDEGAIREFISNVGREYDTAGTERTFVLPDGRRITASGPYGWVTDEGAEIANILSDLEKGGKVSRSFSAKQSARGAIGEGELGPDFVEIDLTHQWLRLYKGNEQTMSVPIISGRAESSTPAGIWYYTNIYQDTILRGPIQPNGEYEWESHVDYWMAFVGNSVGCHDADWRCDWEFSTSPDETPTHYLESGSHGCCNMRTQDARRLYSEVSLGMPVLVHW